MPSQPCKPGSYLFCCVLAILSFWSQELWTAGMRERLPSGFRLGNKGLSGHPSLFPGARGGDLAGSSDSGRGGDAELLDSLLPSSGVGKNLGQASCLMETGHHPSMIFISSAGHMGWPFHAGLGWPELQGVPCAPPSSPSPLSLPSCPPASWNVLSALSETLSSVSFCPSSAIFHLQEGSSLLLPSFPHGAGDLCKIHFNSKGLKPFEGSPLPSG